MGVRCVLTHVESGWSERSELIAQPERCVGGRMNGIQARGAFVTYAQRYTLLAVLGTTADVDTDAYTAPEAPQAPAAGDTGLPPTTVHVDSYAPQEGAQGPYEAPGDGPDGIPF